MMQTLPLWGGGASPSMPTFDARIEMILFLHQVCVDIVLYCEPALRVYPYKYTSYNKYIIKCLLNLNCTIKTYASVYVKAIQGRCKINTCFTQWVCVIVAN